MEGVDLDEAIQRFLDGELSEDGQRALAKALRADLIAERRFLLLLRLDGNLSGVFQEREGARAGRAGRLNSPQPMARPRAGRLLHSAWPYLLAAGLLAGVTAYFMRYRDGGSSPASSVSVGQVRYVAELALPVKALPVLIRRDGSRETPSSGAPLFAGDRIETHAEGAREGTLTIAGLDLFGGALVELAAGTTLDLDEDLSHPLLTLQGGQLYADSALLSQAGRSLRVQTPHASLATCGTRFELFVSAQQSRVRVEEGEVDFSNALGAQKVAALQECSASADAAPTIPSAVPLAQIWRGLRGSLADSSAKITGGRTRLLQQWSFSGGPPQDLQVVMGKWELARPGDVLAGLPVKAQVGFLLPLEIPDEPVRVQVSGAWLEPEGMVGVFRATAQGPARVATWKSATLGNRAERSEVKVAWYFVGTYAVHEVDGVLQTLHKYPFENPHQLLVVAKGMRLTGLEVQALSTADVPDVYRKPELLAKTLRPFTPPAE